MKQVSAGLLFSFLLLPFAMIYAQNTTDYLGIKGSLSFQKKAYNLAWSSHPASGYYKQEYLQKDDNLSGFKSMMLLEVLSGSAKLADVVATKVNELKGLKKTNPMVQFELLNNEKTGEYLLDFLLSANAPDGSPSIVERNVYRYKTITDKNGKAGILLFGISSRAYCKDINPFLKELKTTKAVLVNDVLRFILPAVRFE